MRIIFSHAGVTEEDNLSGNLKRNLTSLRELDQPATVVQINRAWRHVDRSLQPQEIGGPIRGTTRLIAAEVRRILRAEWKQANESLMPD